LSKKILIVTEYFYPEEFKINEIALAWQEKGYKVDILTQNPTYPAGVILNNYKNSWYSKEDYKGLTIYRVKAVTGYKTSLFKKILKYFTFMVLGSFVALKIGKKYDYVFGFDVGALTGMVPAVLIQKYYKKPVTLWIQDIWPDSVYAYGFKKGKVLEYTLNKFVKFVYRNSTNLAVSAKGFIGKIEPYLDSKKRIEYLPNWADELNDNLEAFEFSKDKKIQFTFAGNIGKVQNLENVINAYGKLPKEYIEKSQLNIIGDGSELETLKDIVENREYKNIVFWGRKPRDEMSKYFKASDFLIVSLEDKPIFLLTVPAKIQTYIAAKKPILAILNGDASAIVKDNNLGYCAQPNSIDEIKVIFKKAINAKPEEIENFTKNCEDLTKTVFDKDKIVNSLLDITEGSSR